MLHVTAGSGNLAVGEINAQGPPVLRPPIGPALVNHFRFFIAHAGYGSIAPKRGETVHGVLWRISARDRAALDEYEEVERGLYRPEALPVHWNGKFLRALVYIANDAASAAKHGLS